MLKVKDNVDLKELEKYGFKGTQDYYIDIMGNLKGVAVLEGIVRISKERKEIDVVYSPNEISHIFDNFYSVAYNELVYDLIKADLIEKVDEE
jgi:hypothetical protein